MKWSELPVEARRYIIYHTLISPVLITWYALPYYLLKTGYTVLEVGIVFTVAQVVGVPVTIALGKVFTQVDIRKGLATIDIMDVASLIFFSLAYGPLAPVMVAVGRLIDEASGYFYFLYPAYERVIYPEDRMKEALTWHLRLPELSIIISYPVLGYILGYLCGEPYCFRYLFLFLAMYELALVPYVFLFFKPIVLKHENSKETRVHINWRKYGVYVVADVIFMLAWSLAPALALVYLVTERFSGNMFHIALVEAFISIATLVSLAVIDKIPEPRAFWSLQVGTLITIAGLLTMVLTTEIPVLMLAAFVTRFGDSFIFVFKRTWLYSMMGRHEASVVSAVLSSIRRVVTVVSPGIAGALAYVDPRLPYIACLTLLAVTIPLYRVAQLRK